jgi:hypothetical protein
MAGQASEPILGESGEESIPSSRYTSSRRARNDTRDYTNPHELRGIIQSMEEQMDTIRKEQRQNQDAQRQNQETIMQMLVDLRARGPGPTPLRDGSDPNSISSSNTHGIDEGLYDEIHPSVEEGVDFEGSGPDRTIPLPPPPQSSLRNKGPIRPTNPLPRNTSVPMSHMTYGGPPRLTRSIPESNPLSNRKDPTFKQ